MNWIELNAMKQNKKKKNKYELKTYSYTYRWQQLLRPNKMKQAFKISQHRQASTNRTAQVDHQATPLQKDQGLIPSRFK